MKYTHDFGNNIKQLRKERRITQDRLANKLGVTGANISKYENNVITPPVEIMCSIADYFGVSVDSLCGREDEGSISLVGLTEEQADILCELSEAFKSQNNNEILRFTGDEKYRILGKIAEYFAKNSGV